MRIVSILFPVFAIAAVGYLVGRRRNPDLSEANRLNMDVFTPALVFAGLAGRHVDLTHYLPLAGAGLFVIIGSGIVGWIGARVAGIDPRTLLPPTMFNNCGNLGLPLAVLAFGEQALAPAVVLFAISNTLHFSFGVWYLDHHAKIWTALRNPSVIAALLGIAVSAAGLTVWEPLMLAIKMIGDIAIPLMLFGLGVRIATSKVTALGVGVIGAVLRPVAGIALAWLATLPLDLPAQQQALLLIFGALPPAVLNYMFAERYHQEPDKVASIVLLGNVASIAVLPVVLAVVL